MCEPNPAGHRPHHRTVCLPDFQGVGIGNALVELMAASFKAAGHRFTTTTSHPAMVGHRARSPNWRMLRGPSRVGRQGATATIGMRKTMSVRRLTCSFEWVGPAVAPEVALDVS
jgi:hypothetical protein